MNVALPLALALAAAGGPRARAASSDASGADAAVAEQVRTLLGVIDTPVPDARWRALGVAAVEHLASAAQDETVLPSRRARAVQGLAVLGGARARAAVLAVVRDEATPFAARAAALEAVGRLLAVAELVRELDRVLRSAGAAHVRIAAAAALTRHGGAEGCAHVRAQLTREAEGAAAPMRNALKRCSAR